MTDVQPTIAGFCDGVKGDDIYGWAWWPDFPDLPVVVELWADDRLVGEAAASDYRPDLRAAGIGHGRYGWKFPLPQSLEGPTPRLLVRAKDGPVLPNGEVRIEEDLAPEASEDDQLKAFVAAVLGERGPGLLNSPTQRPPVHFLLYAPVAADPSSLGQPEYSYGFVLQAFEPLLRRLGEVHVLGDVETEADALYAQHIAKGETSVLLSFAPPHRMVLGLRCPVVPVIAWEFPTIPARVWADDLRHDWRFVLRQTGRAITLSTFAADAVKASMGSAYPVISLPAPVWDRMARLHDQPLRPVDAMAALSIDGFVFDSRGRVFETATASPPAPHRDGHVPSSTSEGEKLPSEVMLEGVVFTAVFSPKDGRKNWADMITAFIAAHQDAADATFVLKMIGRDPSLWWWELHDILQRLPPFACRLVVLEGYLSAGRYDALVAGSHWVVSAARAEGLCLPLIEFMSGRRPAISPLHTAMLDYVAPDNAVIVDSDEEYCGFPHDPLNELTTTRRRVSWPSLRDSFAEAYAVVKDDPDRYAAMADAAVQACRRLCSDEVIAARLDSFLGLDLGKDILPLTPSALIAAAG